MITTQMLITKEIMDKVGPHVDKYCENDWIYDTINKIPDILVADDQ